MLNTSEGKKKKLIRGIIAKVKKAGPYRDHAWYINTAAFYYMTFNTSLFNIIRPSSKEAELTNETLIRVIGVEMITLNILISGELLKQPLYKIYYMLELNNNLLSVGYLKKKGFLFKAFNKRM